MLHAELPVDIVVEDDIGPTLNSYKLIFLADTHVSDAAGIALTAWVKAGGTLVATAGAGMRNEFNASNTAMAALLGITEQAMLEPIKSTIQFIKQDLRFSPPLGQVAWTGSAGAATGPSLGARHKFTVSNPAANITATFVDGGCLGSEPGSGSTGDCDSEVPAETASIALAVGKGRIEYHGWLPGFAYFFPAIPLRPADRGGTDNAFTHFVPSNFSAAALELVTNASVAAGVQRQVVCSNHLVHGRAVVAASKGIVVPLTNWAGSPITTALNVTVSLGSAVLRPAMTVELASGGLVVHSVVTQPAPGVSSATFTLEGGLDVADALIIR